MSDMMTAPELEFAPEPPPKGPGLWMRDNLFSTPASIVMTIIAFIVVVLTYRGLLGFVFNPGGRWDAVTFNMKLLMVQAYPPTELWRVWGSVGAIFVLAAASFAMWRIGGMAEPRNVGKGLMGLGGGIVLGGLLAPFSSSGRITWIVAGVVLLGGGWALRALTGERAKQPIIPMMGLVGIGMAIIAAIMWTVDVPFPGRDADGVQLITQQPISTTTTIPWTIIFALTAITYAIFRLVADKSIGGAIRGTLTVLWLLSFPVLLLVVLRDPGLDWSRAASFYLPVFVGFAVAGWLILAFVSRPKVGELGRIIGALLLVVAFISFAISMPFAIRFLLLFLCPRSSDIWW